MNLDDLIDAYLDEAVDGASLSELYRLLGSDENARRKLAFAVDQHRALLDLAAAPAVPYRGQAPASDPHKGRLASEAVPKIARIRRSHPTGVLRAMTWSVAAVAGITALGYLFWTAKPSPGAVRKDKPSPGAIRENLPRQGGTVVLERVIGDVKNSSGGSPKSGDLIPEGGGVSTPAGDSRAVIRFEDSTRIELESETRLTEISNLPAKRVVLGAGKIVGDVVPQPSAMMLLTPHAQARILGTRFALSAAAATRLEVKEGRIEFTRLEDRRSVEVMGGFHSVAGAGVDLVPKPTTRGHMMAGAAIWGEDFGDPAWVQSDWIVRREGIPVNYSRGLEFSPAGGPAEIRTTLTTRFSFAAPLRVGADISFTHLLRGTWIGLRLGSWKRPEVVHADLDQDRYYLTAAGEVRTKDAPNPLPRQERWTVEVRADGTVGFFVDGNEILRGRRPPEGEEFHVNLLVIAKKDVPPGARVRFGNLVVEDLPGRK